MLELEQEEELEYLREAKLMYSRRKNEDNKRIKKLEDTTFIYSFPFT